jgi:predicted DNA-binding protein
LTVKPKEPLPPESIKGLLKAKINPSKIRVGINTLRTHQNGQVLIETSSRKELEAIEKDINEKCGEKLEANAHKLRSPRVVILNIPKEISVENVEDTLLAQNPDMNLKQGDINAKFSYQTKKHGRNLVIEVEAGTRKLLLLQQKIKLGWQICTVHDYVVATSCYKCSKYNHRASFCWGEKCCPLCAGSHKMKDCSANPQEYKCINCLSYNKHNQGKTICINHSSLDKNCLSLLAVLEKQKINTNY